MYILVRAISQPIHYLKTEAAAIGAGSGDFDAFEDCQHLSFGITMFKAHADDQSGNWRGRILIT